MASQSSSDDSSHTSVTVIKGEESASTNSLMMLEGAAEVCMGTIESFLTPQDVRTLNKVEAYSEAFSLEKFFCKCGRMYKLLPLREGDPGIHCTAKRTVTDWSKVSHYGIEAVYHTFADFL